MRIFNLRFICKDETPTEGVKELNTYSLGDAADVGLGLVYGLEFFITLESNKTFYLVQCEDEALIYFVPDGPITRDDYKLVFSHNTYEDMYDILETKASFNEAVMLRNLWLYSIDGSTRYNTQTCLGVA